MIEKKSLNSDEREREREKKTEQWHSNENKTAIEIINGFLWRLCEFWEFQWLSSHKNKTQVRKTFLVKARKVSEKNVTKSPVRLIYHIKRKKNKKYIKTKSVKFTPMNKDACFSLNIIFAFVYDVHFHIAEFKCAVNRT